MRWVSVVVVLALGVLIWLWRYGRARSMVERWARSNGLRLVDTDYRSVFLGPFFWTTSKNQLVYHVTVETPDGRRRRGFVRCGGWFAGLLSDKVDVRWEDQA